MRIAMFHATLPEPGRKPGGVEVFAHRLATQLVRRGHSITFISLTPPPSEAEYEHWQLSRKAWVRRRLGRTVVAPLLLDGLDLSGFDVLHLHGDDWFYFNRRLPTVRTMHGSALREAQKATTLKRRLANYFHYPLEGLSSRLATVGCAISEGTKQIYPVLDRVIPNGVDTRLFSPGIRAENPTILFVGTWEGRKRGKWLFEVFTNEIRPKLPTVELCMVSDYAEEAQGVRWIRYRSDQELAALFRQAWAFCLPSTYEGFGIPYIEAMASGTPVVASENEGALEVLGNGKYGMIVPDVDMGKALVGLLEDEKQWNEYRRIGLVRAQTYSWEQISNAYESAYVDAIERWNAVREHRPNRFHQC